MHKIEHERPIREGHSDTCYHMDEPYRYYAKRNKPVTKGHLLYDSTYMRYLESSNSETESRMVVARGWGEGRIGCYCLTDAKFQFCKMKNILEMDGCDGCTTIGRYLMPLRVTVKKC